MSRLVRGSTVRVQVQVGSGWCGAQPFPICTRAEDALSVKEGGDHKMASQGAHARQEHTRGREATFAKTRHEKDTNGKRGEGGRDHGTRFPVIVLRRWWRERPTITRTRTPHGRTSTTTDYGASRTRGTGTDARCTNGRDVRRERPQAKRGDTEEKRHEEGTRQAYSRSAWSDRHSRWT